VAACQNFSDATSTENHDRRNARIRPTRLIVYCGDYKCAHSVVIDASRWSDDVRLSDLEPLFVCKGCGHRGADVRPLFEKRTAQAGEAKAV
jgi:hypothetical protein